MIRKILIVSLDNLGDFVFASSLTLPLRRAFPEARIHLFSKEYTAPLSVLIEGLSGSLAADPFWDKSPGRPKGSLGGFLRRLILARRENFDVALCASHSWRPLLCARLCAKKAYRLGAAPDPDRPVLESLSELLEPLGIDAVLRCSLDDRPLREIKKRIAEKTAGLLAGLHPFAGDARRCAPPQVFQGVAEKLKDRGLTPLWVGTPSELRALRAAIGANDGVFLDQISNGGVLNLAAALSACGIFIGHDSGPLHLANALGVPVLGIFAPGQPRRTFPQGRGPWEMISKLSPDDVKAADIVLKAEELLTRSRQMGRN